MVTTMSSLVLLFGTKIAIHLHYFFILYKKGVVEVLYNDSTIATVK